MKTTCAIISGGEFSPLSGIENCDTVIACDRGLGYALDNNIIPSLAVGDFDSYSGRIPAEIRIKRLPVEKDDTDTMSAIRYALEYDYNEIHIYCALGGRLDHLLGNIQAASFCVKKGRTVFIHGSDNEFIFFTDGKVEIPKRENFSLSVLSLSDKCTGVSISGTKYRLENAVLSNRFPVGISNEWDGNAEISVCDGILAVIMSRLL